MLLLLLLVDQILHKFFIRYRCKTRKRRQFLLVWRRHNRRIENDVAATATSEGASTLTSQLAFGAHSRPTGRAPNTKRYVGRKASLPHASHAEIFGSIKVTSMPNLR